MWKEVARFIREKRSFLLTSHIHPEGDAIGSEMALKAFLESLGKSICIVNSSPTPRNCAFLDPDRQIRIYPDEFNPRIMDAVDGLIILDVNGWIHLGSFAEVVKKSSKPRVCIDHHEGLENEFVDMLVSDTSAASTGVLVYELIGYMGGEVSPGIAEAIYASLITDTGTFRFSNTDSRAFRIAADLCTKGIDPFVIHRKVFANRNWEAARLIGPVLNTLRSEAEGKLAWIYLTQKMLADAQAGYEDSDGLLDLVRSIKGVELCLFFKETTGDSIKVSLRSNGRVDAYQIARKHGGGGHRMAAGMSMEGQMESVISAVVGECLEVVGSLSS